MTISADYDSMIAKLIVWAPTRDQAIARLARAIDEYEIAGVPTTLPLLRALCDEGHVRDARYGTATLEAFAARHFAGASDAATAEAPETNGAHAPTLRVEVNDRLYRVRLLDLPAGAASASASGSARRAAPRAAAKKRSAAAHGNDVVSPMHGVVVELKCAVGDAIEEQQVVAVVEAMKMMNEIRAHKAGTIAATHANVGDTVEANAPLATIA